ncbi:pantoate--beta-alanine ligase [Dokdonella sp.]|uniref:pantoate--beta-alanine ligase n=1 Tax=Dokdonella sp. TaxID=2291710 RepID=UPI0031BF9634|nr:pantoate--beta-alanine ligase [Dokdonella sp.]
MRTVIRGAELRMLLAEARRAGRRIGFVPTMGNLHAGHHSLISLAREKSDLTIASVFVNPTQFGPSEDFARYPRTPDADAAGLAAQGCDVMFLPTVEELYPLGAAQAVQVRVPGLSEILEGAIRPGHFDGVATVVAKLFNLVQPDLAVFGQKDYQQLLVVRRMATDLAFPIEILAAPIVREASGLAMSSRNQYLDADQRERAAAIHATLCWMVEAAAAGRTHAEIEHVALTQLHEAGLVPDYAVIRRAADLGEPVAPDDAAVALVAARLGTTRLIDNLLLD